MITKIIIVISLIAVQGCLVSCGLLSTQHESLWRSSITPEIVAKSSSRKILAIEAISERSFLFLEELPYEQNRRVLSYRQSHSDEKIDLFPANLSVKKTYPFDRLFSSFENSYAFIDDNNTIWQGSTEEKVPQKLVLNNFFNINKIQGFKSLAYSPQGNYLIGVLLKEDGREGIFLIDAQKNLILLDEGADFYDSVVFGPQENKLAWIEWKKPFFKSSWSQIRMSNFDQERTKLTNRTKLEGLPFESYESCAFLSNGQLVFTRNHPEKAPTEPQDYTNLYLLDGKKKVHALFAETGNIHSLHQKNETTWGLFSKNGIDQVVALNFQTSSLLTHDAPPFERIHHLSPINGTYSFVYGSYREELPALSRLTAEGGVKQLSITPTLKDFLKVNDLKNSDLPTIPEAKSWNISNGQLWLPQNSKAKTEDNYSRPLMVMLKSRSSYLNFEIPFWTSRGFALFIPPSTCDKDRARSKTPEKSCDDLFYLPSEVKSSLQNLQESYPMSSLYLVSDEDSALDGISLLFQNPKLFSAALFTNGRYSQARVVAPHDFVTKVKIPLLFQLGTKLPSSDIQWVQSVESKANDFPVTVRYLKNENAWLTQKAYQLQLSRMEEFLEENLK